MYKNNIIFNLLIILFLNLTSIYAHEITLHRCQCGNNQSQSDWNALLTEGHQIDLKAAALAQQLLNGGHYSQHLHVVIPDDAVLTEVEWKKAKERIARAIGPIPNLSNPRITRFWKNSAKSVDELYQDALSQALSFKADFLTIASFTGTTIFFGADDQHIVKARDSIANKVSRDARTLNVSEEEAIAKISDALRGTIIVDDFFQISAVIAEIIRYVDYKDGEVVFKNIWTEERKQDGYVGIHAKILLPMPYQEPFTEQRTLIAEMQIHFRAIVDGTDESPKEREHAIYESIRSENEDPSALSAASRLLYLTAMQDVLRASQKNKD